MNLLHCLRVGNNEIIIAAKRFFTTVMSCVEIHFLKAGAHGAVKNEYALIEGIQESPVCILPCHCVPPKTKNASLNERGVLYEVSHSHLSESPFRVSDGIGTSQIIGGCRGFNGPFPPPLWMSPGSNAGLLMQNFTTYQGLIAIHTNVQYDPSNRRSLGSYPIINFSLNLLL